MNMLSSRLSAVPETHASDGRRIWTCAACGKRDVWGDEWRWFGRYGMHKDWEEHIIERVVCSAACAGTDEVIV